jgi:hypothetical protein
MTARLSMVSDLSVTLPAADKLSAAFGRQSWSASEAAEHIEGTK